MGRRYADEVQELAQTYAAVRALGMDDLRDVVRIQSEFNRRSAYFVGSGGALALAQLASHVHGLASTYPSKAVTPLTLTVGGGVRVSNSTVGFFSARARHPDVRLAARAVRARPSNKVVLLTQLSAHDVVPALSAHLDEVITLPRTFKDGFLATNSILAMGGAWLKAAGHALPESLPLLEGAALNWPEGATRLLVLFGPDQIAAALDLEARLSETGLLDVQLADLRNMAHGRHVGLLNRLESTAVVALGDPSSRALVDKTIAVLPPSVEVLDLSTTLDGPVGTLDALAGSMRLVDTIGVAQGVDPGQPRVSLVGRKLYHLPWTKLASSPDGRRPARVKALAAGMVDSNTDDLDAWTDAWHSWSASVIGRSVSAIVLDYDGTCVQTPRRTEPPAPEVQSEISRLLDQGVRFAIASGRGPSILGELRCWVPQKFWSEVAVGIYNGALTVKLADDVERGTSASGDLRAAAELLSERLIGNSWEIAARRWQVTVERRGQAIADAAATVAAVLEPAFGHRLKVVQSGHSIDIVPADTSKRSVVDTLGIDLGEVLLIGDQGEFGGNDFELLSHSDLSLSVDRVSADASRCWNLSEDGTTGPALLANYLRAVRPSGRHRAAFMWKPTMRRPN